MTTGMSVEKGIKTVGAGGRHVVILGAGASIAATIRNPEKNNLRLPAMNNFIAVLGLEDIVMHVPEHLRSENFEELYSRLYDANPKSELIEEIEMRVVAYFSKMELPDVPTIYDYLLMSLRPKDMIATFNWDPFLYQAYCRNSEKADMPYLSFLHGNVALGYSVKDKRCGPSGMYSRNGGKFEPTKLLYPIKKKNYSQDEFIKQEWQRLQVWIGDEDTKRVTIFGYGAPASDTEAVSILHSAWGGGEEREEEQFEVIDVSPEDDIRMRWDNFIHSHHYDYGNNFFDSVIAHYPRRTGESFFHHYFPTTPEEAFMKSNPVPQDFQTLDEMWDWYKPLIQAEQDWKQKGGKYF